MAADEIDLQLGQSVRRNSDVREFAKARRHAVHDLVLLDNGVDDSARSQHALPGLGRETDAKSLDRDGVSFINGECVAVDEELLLQFRPREEHSLSVILLFCEESASRLPATFWSIFEQPWELSRGQDRVPRDPIAIPWRQARSPLRPTSGIQC